VSDDNRKKRKKRKRNLIADWLGYILLRIAVVFLSLFKIETNLRFACFLGRLLWKHYHRGRLRAIENLQASFPEKDDTWIQETGRRSFEHLAMLAVDVLFTPRIVRKSNWRLYSSFKNAERVKWMLQEGKGLILATAHYSNFEIVGYMLGLFGFNIYSVARPLDNKFISRYLYSVRQQAGQIIIDKKGAAEQMGKILSTGAGLGFIADQDAGKKGIFVDFFGRYASTYKSIGLLAFTYNFPIVVGCSRRIDNRFFFEISMTRIIMPDEWIDMDDPVFWITSEFTKAIEKFIREDPTQYWWIHRRWKHRPKDERAQDPKSQTKDYRLRTTEKNKAEQG